MKEKAVVILSGGVDSTTLLYELISHNKMSKDPNREIELYAMSFDYGQKHRKELECAETICKELNIPHKTLNLSVLNEVAPSALTRDDIDIPKSEYDKESMKATVVPNRNMVFLSLATAYAISVKAKYLYYGAHFGDHAIYADCRKIFVDAMYEAIKLCDDSDIELRAPYAEIDKSDIVKKGQMLNIDYLKTWSCYVGKEKACGKCGTCIERLKAFKKANMKDLIEYE